MKHLVLVTQPCQPCETIEATSQQNAAVIAGKIAREDRFNHGVSIAYYVEFSDGQRVHCVWPDHVRNL